MKKLEETQSNWGDMHYQVSYVQSSIDIACGNVFFNTSVIYPVYILFVLRRVCTTLKREPASEIVTAPVGSGKRFCLFVYSTD